MTSLRYNYTSANVPGAYYGPLPELPVVQVATPGNYEFFYNATEEYLNSTGAWDMLYTIRYNSPDHLSVFSSETGYQYSENFYFGSAGGGFPPNSSQLTLPGPVRLNSTTIIWTAGDSLVYQLVELGEDRRTPTGRRVFSQNMTLVTNETNPVTATPGLTDGLSRFATRSITATSSRLPPDTTYTQWTAQAAVTSSGSAVTGSASGATASPTQGNAGERVKTSGSLWRAGLGMTLVSLVFGSF